MTAGGENQTAEQDREAPISLRHIYTACLTLALPVLGIPLLSGDLRCRVPVARWRERLGFGPGLPSQGLWVHGVSVGEVQAAAALIREIRARHPALPITVTTTTATGAQHAAKLLDGVAAHRFLPLDLPGAVHRFLERTQPACAVMMETELWPNLYRACRTRGIPLVIANARMTERAHQRYQRVAGLLRETLAGVNAIAAQTQADADRFSTLGAPEPVISVVGNVKFDQTPDANAVARAGELRNRIGQRPVWVAGSTHEGEERLVLAAHRQIRETHPDALLVLVPRHPERFSAVRRLLAEEGWSWAARSSGVPPTTGQQVWLVDSMGELQSFYALADLAFVGGTLVPVGGHNLLEPAALGVPLLCGEYTNNVREMRALFEAGEAITVVADQPDLAAAVTRLLRDPALRRARGAAARAVTAANGGALDRVMNLVQPYLPSLSPASETE